MTSEDRQPNWITIKTADGRSVAGKFMPGLPVIAGSASDLFDLVRLEGGTVALMAFATQGYVSVQTDRLMAWPREIGETERFSMIDGGNGQVAFQLPDGVHYLSAPAGDEVALGASATALGPNELFVLTPFDLSQLPQGGPGCCGAWTRPADDETDLVWNDETHKQILEWATEGMKRPEIQNDETRRFLSVFWSRLEFHKAAFGGLDDADYKAPWRGETLVFHPDPRKGIYSWHDHFYNPMNGKNYRGDSTNAMTEGRRYFHLSVYEGMRAMKVEDRAKGVPLARSGHHLGLSLHFLTDLTQPMHAANFTNVFGEDGNYPWPNTWLDKRHSGFEGYAEDQVAHKGYFADYSTRFPMDHGDVATGDVDDAEWFLYHTARNQHLIFRNEVRALAHKKNQQRTSDWGSEADKALTLSLQRAPKTVARYLAYWAKCVNQSWDHIDPGFYYRIVEPTRNEWVCINNRHFMRNNMANGQDQMFFVFNPDGTWSIGNRMYKNRLWLVYWGPGGYWVGETRDGGSTPPPSARFRLVRNHAPGGKDGVWIYDSQDQPVVVNEEVWPGYLMQWPPNAPGRALFKLQRMERIPDNERAEIQALWPDFLKHPWHGRA